MGSQQGPPAGGPDDQRRDPGPLAHPEANHLQRHADGQLDAGRDAALLTHLETCAVCLAEVERIRRASAAQALSSAPPPDLFARIKARRAAGERVLLPVDELRGPPDSVLADDVTTARDGHPALIDVHRVADGEYDADADASLVAHVRGCEACLHEVEEARRVTAALSLLSHPPVGLSERIKARRAAGERVILPVAVAAGDAPALAIDREVFGSLGQSARTMSRGGGRGPGWRRPRWGALAIAATLLLTIGLGRLEWKRSHEGSTDSATSPPAGGPAIATGTPKGTPSTGPRGAGSDSGLVSLPTATALRSAADSAERLWLALDPDSRRTRWRETKLSVLRLQSAFRAMTALRSTTDSLTLGLVDSAFDGTALAPTAAGGTRELATILARYGECRLALVGYSAHAPSDSAHDPLAGRLSALRDALVSGGVAADRITVTTASTGNANPDRAHIEVVVLAPKPVPEIR